MLRREKLEELSNKELIDLLLRMDKLNTNLQKRLLKYVTITNNILRNIKKIAYNDDAKNLLIDNLGLKKKTVDTLKKCKPKIKTLGDIANKTTKQMYNIKGLGRAMIREIELVLHCFGLDYKP